MKKKLKSGCSIGRVIPGLAMFTTGARQRSGGTKQSMVQRGSGAGGQIAFSTFSQ